MTNGQQPRKMVEKVPEPCLARLSELIAALQAIQADESIPGDPYVVRHEWIEGQHPPELVPVTELYYSQVGKLVVID